MFGHDSVSLMRFPEYVASRSLSSRVAMHRGHVTHTQGQWLLEIKGDDRTHAVTIAGKRGIIEI
jgi:hypothetical protein